MDFSILDFCQKIRSAPAAEPPENNSLRKSYICRHIFMPYTQGKLRTVGEIDMEKFDAEDVIAVRGYVETVFEECEQNCELRNHLQNASPSGCLSPVFF